MNYLGLKRKRFMPSKKASSNGECAVVENWECKDRHVPLLRIRYDVPLEQIENIVLQFLEKETV